MCCYINNNATKKFIQRLKSKGQKFFYGYKQLNAFGKALHNEKFQYSPGKHEMKQRVVNYNTQHPKGFHFTTTREALCTWSEIRDNEPIIRVKVYLKDLIGLDNNPFENTYNVEIEGVANAIHIEKSEWERAKFYPNLKVGQLVLCKKRYPLRYRYQGKKTYKYLVVEDGEFKLSLLNLKTFNCDYYYDDGSQNDLVDDFDSIKILKEKFQIKL